MIHPKNYKIIALLRPAILAIMVTLCFALFFAGVYKVKVDRDKYYFTEGFYAGYEYAEVIFSPSFDLMSQEQRMEHCKKHFEKRYKDAKFRAKENYND